jgi:hypothetical protein
MKSAREVEVRRDGITWMFEGKRVTCPLKRVDSVMMDKKRRLVFALIGGGPSSDELVCFLTNGEEKFRVRSPAGFHLRHLARGVNGDVQVVCGSSEEVDGWYDWHFAIDENTGALRRAEPSY